MAKKVAVLAVNPVNGFGLFQYLEAFYEKGIPYTVFAVADTREIKSNSGITLIVDDIVANLKGHENDFNALVFGCGDAVPVFRDNVGTAYNQDMIAVLKAFVEKGKVMIGHCAAGMMYELAGIADGKRIAVHPLAKGAVQKAIATDEKSEIDGQFFTAQTENTIWTMMDKVIEVLQ